MLPLDAQLLNPLLRTRGAREVDEPILATCEYLGLEKAMKVGRVQDTPLNTQQLTVPQRDLVDEPASDHGA